jgi:hypothetical protein
MLSHGSGVSPLQSFIVGPWVAPEPRRSNLRTMKRYNEIVTAKLIPDYGPTSALFQKPTQSGRLDDPATTKLMLRCSRGSALFREPTQSGRLQATATAKK